MLIDRFCLYFRVPVHPLTTTSCSPSFVQSINRPFALCFDRSIACMYYFIAYYVPCSMSRHPRPDDQDEKKPRRSLLAPQQAARNRLFF